MKLELSVERNEAGKIIEVFFDQTHEPTTYEALKVLPSDAFVLTGGTAFQQKVWLELRKIPVGTTISYQEMAERVGSPKAQQAVGQALAKNPLPVILPCHRVTRKDGSLGGFMGQDRRQDIKQKILDFEQGQIWLDL
ncbi:MULTISPECIES: methylated-DNA--[protein]-cysteine S-methyltransferase [unclassified Lactococcus]|uniref:methylated-DNA--[protein]-cysteine S-methyltransferase n=1 Tax=unclassified Lactococcus TaxID=2643510 RepID=UPI0011C8E87B|nr:MULTISPECIES: methylated-DNA--[protein]-cysteine S-methyltransferase [unclassified Lactococcus]MQW23795.1 methylated-DNA--[protein]-cysteine S-methyltransferase [Lactococcus sp. dk101]TXK37381.1 methylated-DNA--[protein]-cysteine S-methyltransferase [Lactococcus sp. dk310]TXK48692.1 methylated-DNA--[protein]-cysteine S-methyltransferase [Lactococcus sp. dk322]